MRDADYPWGVDDDQAIRFLNGIERGWGKGMTPRVFAPSIAQDERQVRSWAKFERMAVSPRGGSGPVQDVAGDRREGRAAHDPGSDSRNTPNRRSSHAGGRGPVHRGADSGCEVRRARRHRPLPLGRRLARGLGRGGGVPHGRAARTGARPCARHRDVHRHRRLHGACCGTGRSRVAKRPRPLLRTRHEST